MTGAVDSFIILSVIGDTYTNDKWSVFGAVFAADASGCSNSTGSSSETLVNGALMSVCLVPALPRPLLSMQR